MSPDQNTSDKSHSWSPDLPYNQLSALPPPTDIETKSVLKQCILARAALAELKQAAELIPNQGVLIKTLPLLEAQASSEIENIITTTDRLFQFSQGNENAADPATKEALRYSRSLLEGFRSLSSKPLCTRTAELVCTAIKGTEMSVRRIPGTALGSDKSGAIIYTPPAGEDQIRTLLANWERFLHESTEFDPLIRMAAAHYQFEAIHPFTDGNGRTGRVLNSLFLIQENLLTLPILYLSRYIIAHKNEYYRLLLQVTSDQAWEEWIIFILRGVEETANWTTGKISAIRDLQEHTIAFVKLAVPRMNSRELIEIIFEQPYCRIQDVVEANIAARQTASVYLKELVNLDILEERTIGREKLFIHPKLMKLLTQDQNEFIPYA